jgi:uncharacterized protein (DUF305 family)
MSKQLPLIITVAVLAILLVGVGLYASTQFGKSDSSKGSSSSSMGNMMMAGMDHGGMGMKMTAVRDDKSFLENMIPHHEEAVMTSNIVLKSTTDPDIKQFATQVIADQSKEITMMKNWYRDYFGVEYASTAMTSMMGDLTRYQGVELDKMYVKGMIGHHMEAVKMARDIQSITTKSDIKTLAENIIRTQSSEIMTLQGWLVSKYGENGMMGGMKM